MNVQAEQVLVDPISAIRFVARHLQRPGERLSVMIEQVFVGPDQQRFQRGRLVRLTGGEMEVQRMSVRVAQQMNFARKSPARAT